MKILPAIVFLFLGVLYQSTITASADQGEETIKLLIDAMEEMKKEINKLNTKITEMGEMKKDIEKLNDKLTTMEEEKLEIQDNMTIVIQKIKEINPIMNDKFRELKTDVNSNKNQQKKRQNNSLLNETELKENLERATEVELDYKELRAKTRALSDEVSKLKSTARGQEQEIRRLRDPPVAYYCGYKELYNQNSQIVPYDSLFYSYSNQGVGGLDTSTGTFSAPFPGTYRITYSVYNEVVYDQSVEMHIQKNGVSIPESLHWSWYSSTGEQGGRSILLHLDLAETVALYCDLCAGNIKHVLFCINLEQFDP